MQHFNTIRLVIADDHQLARCALRSLLSELKELEVVAEAEGGYQAIKLCRDWNPDMALVDLRMGDLDGLETTRRIKAVAPRTQVVIVSVYDNPRYMLAALAAGADGYLLKDASFQEYRTMLKNLISRKTFRQ